LRAACGESQNHNAFALVVQQLSNHANKSSFAPSFHQKQTPRSGNYSLILSRIIL
jgi:hypothetical protein